jgi:parvulin-like peptidyl-prolyl isomerase
MAQKEKKAVVKDKDSSSSEIARRFKQNPAVFIGTVVVLVLVIVSFVVVPAFVPESTNSGGDFIFGYYDKAPVSWIYGNMFAQYVDQAISYYQSQGVETSDFRVAAEIWRQAYEMAVTHTAVLQMMRKSNYSVPEKTVNRAVAQRPEFQENGRFSQALYKQKSDSARLVIWRQTQDELTKVMFFNDFFELLVPSGEMDFIANMSSPMKKFEVVFFKVDDYPESYYFSYAQEHPELFNTIHLSRITVSGEREARKILASIRDGTSAFEDAARDQSQDGYADMGGDMGNRYSFELDSEISNLEDRRIIFALGRGEISNVIKTGDNWSFFRVENELTQADFADEAVMEKVRSYVRNFERGRMEDWAIAQANDFISEAAESGLENAARWRYLERHSFGPLPVNYGGIDLFTSLESFTVPGLTLQDLQNLSRNENFWKAAFSARLNTPSEPLVHGNNVFVFIPVEEIEADEESIQRITSMYSSYWLRSITEQSLQPYFLNNEKMDDRFWDAYFRYLMP